MKRLVPLSAVFREIDSRAGIRALSLPLLSVSQYRGVLPRAEIDESQPRASDLSIYKVCLPGDIVLNKMSANKGAVGVARVAGLVSPDYLIMRPTALATSGFIGYLLKSHWMIGQMTARLRGIGSADGSNVRTPRVGRQELSTISVSLPSIDDQVAIVEFLDRETAEIDAFIGDQDELIGLLEERRAATIKDAVTRGLDPGVPLKDSGVLWLGRVPEPWSVTRVRYVCKIQTGSSDTVDATEEGSYPLYVRSDTPLRSDDYEFEGEAVLTAGDGAGVGKVFHLVTGRFAAHQRVYVMNRFSGVRPSYFYRYFSSMFRNVALEGTAKSTVDSVRRPMIADLPIAVPPLDEQARIMRFLDESTAEIDAAIVDGRQAIALLRERRAALISAAVTGTLDISEQSRNA